MAKGIVGFCWLEVKLLGPAQLNEVAPVAVPVKLMVVPEQARVVFAVAPALVVALMAATVTLAVLLPHVLLAVRV